MRHIRSDRNGTGCRIWVVVMTATMLSGLFTGPEFALSSGPQAAGLDVNIASEQDLAGLPGIGPVIARRIIQYRQGVGRIRRLDELLVIRGIGVVRLERLRRFLCIRS